MSKEIKIAFTLSVLTTVGLIITGIWLDNVPITTKLVGSAFVFFVGSMTTITFLCVND